MLACIGGYLALQHWGDASVFHISGIPQQFGIIAGIEFVSAFIGVGVLYWLHKQQFVSTWIAFVVGMHFFPLARIFQDKAFYVLATLVIVAAVVPVFIAKKIHISVTTLTGVSTGILLVLFAIRGLILVII